MARIYRTADNQIEVSYPVREACQLITPAEFELIVRVENKVHTIKFVKDQYQLGLYEAKQLVDTVRSHELV